ncbi:MAG: adenosylcobalamin-dependent ribonucleoside-diphosphate reductase [Candidatus Pacearchaeota archaeon]
MVEKIIKRDGRIENFDKTKIFNAIWKAVKAVGGKDKETALKLADKVVDEVNRIFKDKIPTVEDVQDIVEKVLIEEGHAKTAKAYILYRQERRLIREEKKKILQKENIDEIDKSFSLNGLKILASRYLIKDEEGKIIESPKQLFQRVALHVGIVDILYDEKFFSKEKIINKEKILTELNKIKKLKEKIEEYDNKLSIGKYKLNKWHFEGLLRVYERLLKEGKMKLGIEEVLKIIENGEVNNYEKLIDEYFDLMAKKDFLPNSPTLMNAGTRIGQLSACFVLPIRDSLIDIMKTSSDAALIHQSGGGVGINYSSLRPKGDIVASTYGIASGPVSFMDIIDTVTEVVKQGGKRRGANMGILEIWHPDIEEFITIKQQPKKLENFNISVGIWQDFFDALEEDREYPLINPRNKKQVSSISPRKLFDLIAFSTWKCAEPGVLFFDNINKYNILLNVKGFIRSTNPCGEQPLYEHESCNLGSINLKNFVIETEEGNKFDFERFEKVIRIATRFLDNIIDINKYPLKEIEKNTRETRKIGLGVMGLADLLYELEIPYNSEEGYEIMNKIAEMLSYISMDESVEIAKERGSFPLFEKSDYVKGKLPIAGYYEIRKENHNFDWNKLIEKIKKYGIRNVYTTTIAPTGTISMILDVSNGIEPIFSLVFEKHVTVGKFYYVNSVFEKKLKEIDMYNDEIIAKIAKNYGCLIGLEEFDENLKKIFVTAMSIHWIDHILAQAIWQRWISASISKTINMPNYSLIEDIKLAYLIAKELGLKGLTVYRDGSRYAQVLYIPSEEKQKSIQVRPSNYAIKILKEKIKSEYIKKEISEYLKKNFNIDFEKYPYKEEKLMKFAEKIITNIQPNLLFNENKKIDDIQICPLCKNILINEGGCTKCINCGWSSCVIN